MHAKNAGSLQVQQMKSAKFVSKPPLSYVHYCACYLYGSANLKPEAGQSQKMVSFPVYKNLDLSDFITHKFQIRAMHASCVLIRAVEIHV